MQPNIDLVVTRHRPLVALLHERGIITSPVFVRRLADWDGNGTPVIEHASISDVRGKHVLGVLPHHLSSQCASITEIPMTLSQTDRVLMSSGDLPLERMREVAGDPVTYVVRREWQILDLEAELGILASLRRILDPATQHTYRAGTTPCVEHETVMDTAMRLRTAWEEQHPRAKIVARLHADQGIGPVRASYDATTGRTHVLARGRQHWLPADEEIRRNPEVVHYEAVNALAR